MSKTEMVAGVILAAGKGTRMKSDLPKGLHAVCGLPMVEHIGRAMKSAGVNRPIIIIGHGGDQMRESLGDSYQYAVQSEQLGTGHAAMMASDLLRKHNGPVLLAPGDAPLLDGESLRRLLCHHIESGAAVTLATCVLQQPRAYGRIVRDAEGRAMEVVEEKDATQEQRAIKEVCTSIYCFDCQTLLRILPNLNNANAQGEYYLTDVAKHVYKEGGTVETLVFENETVLLGVNDRWQLAEVASIMRQRILQVHALSGVTIIDPTTTYIGNDVTLGPDCTIQPMTVIEGKCSIGAGTVVGPMSRISDSTIGEECVVIMSHVNRATLKNKSRCGPFANLRPGTVLGEQVKIGNFVEVKNSDIGDKASISHLTYIGDATVGRGANIGAGTITCNYDGFDKHRTEIGENAFVGSNSTLIAPVRIGDYSFVAAGSVITADVPEDSLALGRARQEVKKEWAIRWREKHQTEQS